MKIFFSLLLLFVSIGIWGQVTPGSMELSNWDETEPFVNGFAKAFTHGKWFLINKDGALITSSGYEEVRNFSDHLAAVRTDSKWGFINENGREVIHCQFDIVFDFTKPYTAAYVNNNWEVINRNGAVINKADPFYADLISKLSPVIQKYIIPAAANAPISCPYNIDFENGDFLNWDCFVGTVAAVSNTNIITVTPSPPVSGRHSIIRNNSPSLLDQYGLFSTNPPDGSGFAVKLGNVQTGRQAERVRYVINVPADAKNFSLTYQYAVVFQDPGHPSYQQPRFTAKLYDTLTGAYLGCASNEYIATSGLPGFSTSPINVTVRFKPWSSVFINLSAYAGRTLYLEFTTADCTQSAHWGYAYVDVNVDCSQSAGLVEYQCNAPNITTLNGPPGFQSYKWWNNDFSGILGNTQTIVLNPGPPINTQYWVEVIPYNGFGCSDTIPVNIEISYPLADAGPDSTICLGSSMTIGKNAKPNYTYQWTPTSFLSDPLSAKPVCSPPISTTYILSVTDNVTGCTKADTVDITVRNLTTNNTDVNICTGQNYLLPWGQTAFVTGIYRDTIRYTSGCDSLRRNINLTVQNAAVSTMNSIICGGQTFTLPSGKVVNSPGTYLDTLRYASGCDSVRGTVILAVQNSSSTTANVILCGGQSYMLPWGVSVNSSGVYRDTLRYASGCDSLRRTVNVVAQSVYTSSLGANICSGQTITLPWGQTVNKAGIYRDTIRYSSGCDSLQRMFTLTQTTKTVLSKAPFICNDQVYTLPWGEVVTIAGSYRDTIRTLQGCDSIIRIIDLSVRLKPAISLTKSNDVNCIIGTSKLNVTGARTYVWSPAESVSNAFISNPIVAPTQTMRYTVAATALNGCITLDSIEVKMINGMPDDGYLVPTGFSPNYDGMNDCFGVPHWGHVNNFNFTIYNRTGQMIFHSVSPSNCWDGRFKGSMQDEGAYVYVITGEGICGKVYRRGVVMLVK